MALVDLDLCLGDADVFLDTIPDYTLVDVAQNVTRLDFTLLKRSLTKHSSGLYLLPRPVQLEDVPLITPEDLQRVIGLLKATFTHVMLDLVQELQRRSTWWPWKWPTTSCWSRSSICLACGTWCG